MTNPFFDLVDERFRAEKAIVRRGDAVFWGWVRMWHYHQPAVLLDGAVRVGEEEEDDEYIGTVYINDPDTVETARRESNPPIEEMPASAVRPSPYTQRVYGDPDFHTYVRRVRKHGHLGSFPTVRQMEEGYEVVSGHKRIEAAKRADLGTIPVFVVEMDDWEAAVRFIDEHIPVSEHELRGDETGRHRGWYDEEAALGALDELVERWGEEKVAEHPAARRWLTGELPPTDGEDADEVDSGEDGA